MVARDGDGVGPHGAGIVANVDAFGRVARGSSRHLTVFHDDVFLFLDDAIVVVPVTSAVDGVQDAVGGAVQTVAEGVVVAVLVVISHVRPVLAFGSVYGTLGDVDLLVEANRLTLSVVCSAVLTRVGALVLPTILLAEGSGAVSVLPLGDVDTFVEVELGAGSVPGGILSVVDAVLYVDLGTGVTLVRFTVAVREALALAAMTCMTSELGEARRDDAGKRWSRSGCVARSTTHYAC